MPSDALKNNGSPGYIVVEGPIGVGKTTLAKRLADAFGSELMLERAEENPFLPRFYQDPDRTALPTQLYFLFQRAQQIQILRQGDLFRPARIVDFLMDKDRLFASLTLTKEELDLYYQVYNRLVIQAPAPDLVVYLQAPPEVLSQRIEMRAIDYEQSIDEDYLRRVSEAYINFFYHYDRSPLLIVNTADINLSEGDRDFSLLLERIRALNSGRHYFNPRAI